MSQNVEIVGRALEAANRRPKPDFATGNDLYHPEHEFVSRFNALDGGSFREARGFRDWLLNSEETVAWESRLEAVTEIDNDRVLAIPPSRGQARAGRAAYRLPSSGWVHRDRARREDHSH